MRRSTNYSEVQNQPEPIVCEDPPMSKITWVKWSRGMIQAVEHLLYN